MKAKHIVEVLDGTITHNRGNEKSVIKKKREVYALTTALRSLSGSLAICTDASHERRG